MSDVQMSRASAREIFAQQFFGKDFAGAEDVQS